MQIRFQIKIIFLLRWPPTEQLNMAQLVYSVPVSNISIIIHTPAKEEGRNYSQHPHIAIG